MHTLGTDLIRELRHHDLLLAGRLLLLRDRARANHDAPSALLVALLDAIASVDDGAGREIGAFDELPDVLERGVGMIHQVHHRLHNLAQVVGRNVGGHAHRDARRAVDEQVGQTARQHRRLLQPVVEIGHEGDGVFVDVFQHRHGDAREARFGIAVRSRGVAVYRPEIPLPIHQRVAQGEVLDHPHQGVVQRHVAMGVVLPEHIAHDRRALLVRPAGNEPQLVHRVEDAPVDGLQAVAHIGQRARHDDAHRIVEERFL